jgi:ribonucleoside-diphosphate reductase alpha chain
MEVVQTILKRDGTTLQAFDAVKLRNAVSKAWLESTGTCDEKSLNQVLRTVTSSLTENMADVETVQDAVETSLMKHGWFAVAKAYILYRESRKVARKRRNAKIDPKGLSDYIHASKYARWIPELGRREVYEETVARVEAMHIRKFPFMEGEIRSAFDLVRSKRVLPSMRSMQFGGAAIEASNTRIFNCAFSLVDRLEVFSETLFLLLSGCGVGYSVQFDHVDKLPAVGFVNEKLVRHHVVEDTIEGWADALKALVRSYQDGVLLELSYFQIRPAGAPLKTSGGRAPGHLKLKEALERVRGVLDKSQGRKLRPIECHRIMCHAADAVLSGGIRRSACICLFSLDDSEMMYAKTGNWFASEPWFANANNSVVLRRDEVKKKQFQRVFNMTKQFGEPGFYFTDNQDYGVNPCAEIGLYPRFKVDETIQAKLPGSRVGEVYTGFAFCNLCEINAAKLTSIQDFEEVARAATLIGTLQATYTKMPYLGRVSELLAEREALLGIGMTGMLDAPDIACRPEYQRRVAEKIKGWNAEFAARLGINAATRTTAIKPSGTTSLELGGVGSGHHAHHARRYIRRVTADELERVFQAFREVNPHMCVRKPDGKWVIEFPVEAPPGATVRADLGAVQFLEMVRSTQENWVLPGTASQEHAPGLAHNVSNTITVKPDEWEAVSEYVWAHREIFTGVSMLPDSGDKDYAFSPNEEIKTDVDEHRWNALIDGYKPLDYTTLVEGDDATALTSEPACAGGACSIV